MGFFLVGWYVIIHICNKCFVVELKNKTFLNLKKKKLKFNFITLLVCDCSISRKKEIVYLSTHSKHFIYGYMALDIW